MHNKITDIDNSVQEISTNFKINHLCLPLSSFYLMNPVTNHKVMIKKMDILTVNFHLPCKHHSALLQYRTVGEGHPANLQSKSLTRKKQNYCI